MSSQWAFNLRSGSATADSDDDDDSLDNDAGNARAVSDEAKQLDDLDLASREDSVVYKPNPFSIAKINAAARANRELQIPSNASNSVLKSSISVAPQKRTQPRNPIFDGFRKQVQKHTPRKTNNLSVARNSGGSVPQKPALVDLRDTPSGRQNEAHIYAVEPVLRNAESSRVQPRLEKLPSSPLRPPPFTRAPPEHGPRSSGVLSSPLRPHLAGHKNPIHRDMLYAPPKGRISVARTPINRASRAAMAPDTAATRTPRVLLPQPPPEPSPQANANLNTSKPLAPASSYADSLDVPNVPATKKFLSASSSAYAYTNPATPQRSTKSSTPLSTKRKRVDAYDTLSHDENEDWSTLDVAKKTKPHVQNKPDRRSNAFRLPGLLASKDKGRTSGMDASSSRRVVTFLPPPLLSNQHDSDVRSEADAPHSLNVSNQDDGRTVTPPPRSAKSMLEARHAYPSPTRSRVSSAIDFQSSDSAEDIQEQSEPTEQYGVSYRPLSPPTSDPIPLQEVNENDQDVVLDMPGIQRRYPYVLSALRQ